MISTGNLTVTFALDVYGGTNMDEDIEGQVLVADIERRDKT